MNDTKILTSLIIVGVIFSGGLGAYIYFQGKTPSNSVSQTQTQERSPDTVTPTTPVSNLEAKTVAIGSEKVARGDYEKIEGNVIYYSDEGDKFKKMKSDTLILACTTQPDLETTGALDYNQIQRLNNVSYSELAERIKSGMNIVMLSEIIGGELLVHTVATKETVCK